MMNQSSGLEIAELSAAFTSALTMICNRLIERGVLDRAEIKADLAAEVETMREREPSVLKEMILSGLAFALHSPPSPDDHERHGSSPRARERQDDNLVHLTEIDDADVGLKLIGRDD